MRPRPIGAFVVAGLLALVAGCGGGSPSGPSASTVNLVGTWTGTWQFVAAGATVTDDVTATISQAGANATGSWSAASGAAGQLSLTASASTSGTITISQNLFAGANCSASTTFTGTATSMTLDLTLANFTSAGLCQWAAGQRMTLRRP